MNAEPRRWTQATVFPDMWVDPDDDPRETGTSGTDERSILLDYLRRYRLTLQLKCAQLNAEQLARRSVPPSTMSLLGLVRHMAEVERSWFRRTMAGQDVPKRYCTPDSPDEDWDGARADDAVVAEAWQAWRDEVGFADAYVAGTADLSTLGTTRDGDTVPLRDILVHMIEEYARHCGHADLLRECIDGRIGQ
ncbi:DinB family protein [Nakamurella lactea]|uniref:DinB family protein n=1 Tax=Nakamurella lactea TaxID=459515 RepID=UPI0004908D9A|nr:DinB family protein [Nakamurella lactea]